MNAEELITIARDIANRQYPNDSAGRELYHVGLLETRIRELVKRVNELERHPILDLPVVDLGADKKVSA